MISFLKIIKIFSSILIGHFEEICVVKLYCNSSDFSFMFNVFIIHFCYNFLFNSFLKFIRGTVKWILGSYPVPSGNNSWTVENFPEVIYNLL